jgi:serine/threonine-protein kinase
LAAGQYTARGTGGNQPLARRYQHGKNHIADVHWRHALSSRQFDALPGSLEAGRQRAPRAQEIVEELVTVLERLTTSVAQQYRIERELGAGGMALVYLAHDLRHQRPVALKLLRPELSAILGAERFLAEIRTTANLQHPHILPLHDSGEADGLVYYVMPYVEGESLRDRLRREKQLPVDEAVRLAREVASALDYAHRRGVVHRDIKPENILLHDGQALVADFGIALAASRSEGGTRMTETGMSLGTPQYMAPEQAMGEREITSRADVYALGCVLYEMLVGEPPFMGPTPQAIVARLVTEQPRSLTVQRQTVPHHVEAATLRALQKLPADRFATAAQFSEALGNPSLAPHVGAPAAAHRGRSLSRRLAPIAAAILLTAVATSAIWWGTRPTPRPAPLSRFIFSLPEGHHFTSTTRRSLAISPDGSELVYAAGDRVFRRSMASLEAQPVPGTETTSFISNPAYSPDGSQIAFFANGVNQIKRIAAAGGVPVTLTTVENPLGITWDASGIIYAEQPGDIRRVDPNGGESQVLIDLEEGEQALSPQVLPDGRRVLFTLTTGTRADRWEQARVVVQDAVSGKRTVIVEAGSDARWLSSGHLVYAVGGSLFAVAFDAASLEVRSAPVPVVEGVRRAASVVNGTAHYAVAENGTLVYVPGPAAGLTNQLDLAFTDRQGVVETLKLPPGTYEYPRVSPDGKRIAVGTDDGRETVIWIYDLSRTSALRRLTLGGKDRYPLWSADGQWLVFQSAREGDAGIYRQRADGAGAPERLTTADSGTTHVPESWSPRSDEMLFSVVRDGGTEARLQVYSMRTRTVTPFADVRSLSNHIASTFSPDGRWVAYTANEAGGGTANFVFVQPYPPTGARYQISQPEENGHHPIWSPDGRELFYVPTVGNLVSRSVTTQPSFTFGNPVSVPRTFPVAAPSTPRTFDVAPDGRVLGVVAAGSILPTGSRSGASVALVTQINIVLNWVEELKERVRPR